MHWRTKVRNDILQGICKQLDVTFVKGLGTGAFKEVFLVKQEEQELALKVASLSGDLKERYKRETIALQGCSHPAISRIHRISELRESGGDYWCILEEYLPFGTLSNRITNSPLNLNEVRSLGVTLAGAISHLAERKFVHRDIKPDNIIFRTEDEPVLTDFGLVRILGEESLTQDFLRQGPGTPRYAAPEQLDNDKGSIDWRTDQFGLCLVLAELVLGHHAFCESQNDLVHNAILAVVSRRQVPAVNQNTLCSLGFACLVKGLSPWPVQRYRTPDQLIAALNMRI